jgi:hypothetical protein
MNLFIICVAWTLAITRLPIAQPVLNDLTPESRKQVEVAAKLFYKDKEGKYWDSQVESKRNELRKKVSEAKNPTTELRNQLEVYEYPSAPLWYCAAGKDEQIGEGTALRLDVTIEKVKSERRYKDGSPVKPEDDDYFLVFGRVTQILAEHKAICSVSIISKDQIWEWAAKNNIRLDLPSSLRTYLPDYMERQEHTPALLCGFDFDVDGQRVSMAKVVRNGKFEYTTAAGSGATIMKLDAKQERETVVVTLTQPVSAEELLRAIVAGKASLSRWTPVRRNGIVKWTRVSMPLQPTKTTKDLEGQR